MIESSQTDNRDNPLKEITIVDCGEVPMASPIQIERNSAA